MEKPNISIIGLGKLGSPMAAAYASKGYKVIGVDVNPEFVRLINEGKEPVFEPKLAEYLIANRKRISATQNYEEAVLNSDITFIIVPTPSEHHGGFSTKYVIEAGKEIGKALTKKSNFHLVVLTATVTPGSTERDLLPVLEEYSGKKFGTDFGLCYNPEFIALGSVISDLLNPDFILIGESDSKSGDILQAFYQEACNNNPPIKRMNIVNAEITKIALNTFVTTKISYANMIAELCERLPGGNIDMVTDALGCDTRIGHKYLKGAIGFGGPCFPRDNRAIVYSAQKFGLSLPLARATDKINKYQASRLIEKIIKHLPKQGKVGILGLSYKPDTNVIEESQVVEIVEKLAQRGIPIIVYDPAAMDNAKRVLANKVEYASSFKECLQASDVVFLATAWSDFRKIEPSDFKEEDTVLIDCWRMLTPENYGEKVTYIPLGINC